MDFSMGREIDNNFTKKVVAIADMADDLLELREIPVARKPRLVLAQKP